LTTLVSFVRQWSSQFGDRPAIVLLHADLVSSETLTYAELVQASQVIASQLLQRVRSGDRVLLAFDNSLDAVLLFWGCMVAGIVAVPAPAPDPRRSKISWRRIQSMCEDAQVTMAFTRDEHLEGAQEHVSAVPWSTLDALGDWRAAMSSGDAPTCELEPVGLDDLAYLQYTSGSTGRPRGVQITHRNIMAQCDALARAEEVDPVSSRTLTWLPWFHDYGLVHGLLGPAHAGSTSFLMSTQQFLIWPLKWLEAISRHGITHSGAPDFAYEACVNALVRYPDWDFRLDGWKLATCGAEPIRPRTLRRFVEAFAPHGFKPEAFAPSYGLAEAVLAVALGDSKTTPNIISVDRHRLETQGQVQAMPAGAQGAQELVASGMVLPGFDLRIVHPETATTCAADEAGEIWISGPSVGAGYWNQPDASLERFGGTLGESDSPQKYLKTGDLGFLRGRELFVTGRHSDLIIVNGRNIHPQDIEETATTTSAEIRPKGAVACAVEHAGREHVLLLIECRKQLTSESLGQLQSDLRLAIAEAHEVELLDVVLLRGGVLPRTSSGKLQRREARRMYLAGELATSQMKAAVKPPRPEDEQTDETFEGLSAIWADVLNLSHVPADAHFLHMGGDSLTGTQLMSRVRSTWGVDLPLSALFADPTLRGMAATLRTRRAQMLAAPVLADGAKQEAWKAPASERSTDLSHSQERMWFMQTLAPAGSAYNVPLAVRLRGPLQADALEQAFTALIRHHDILQTRFVATDQGPVATPVDTWAFELERIDAPGGEAAASASGLVELLGDLSRIPFDLEQWPLMRATLIRVAPEEHVLLVVLHHIVSDQWSLAVMGKDLSAAYVRALADADAAFPGPQRRFSNYASWHRRWFESASQTLETAYWTRRLAGLRPVALAPDKPRPRQPSFQGASVRLPLPAGLAEGLASWAASHHATLAMAMLALFKVFLHKHTGQNDLAIGMPIANRHHPDSENLIGSLVNTLVIRTSMEGDPDFTTVLARVKEAAVEAYEHQDMPFELLVRALDHKRDPGQPPLFNVMFNLLNAPVRSVHFGEGLSWERIDVDRRASQVDLTLVVDPLLDRSLVIEYATDLFEAASIQRMGDQLLNLLKTAVGNAGVPISRWSPLDQQQKQQLLDWGAGRNTAAAHMGLADFLELGLRISPQSPALVVGERRLSYLELDQASAALAQHLRTLGMVAGRRVGLCLQRSVDMVVALLAIIRSGATYVPLDPSYPQDRIAHQVQDAELSLIIGTSETLTLQRAGQVPVLFLDGEWPSSITHQVVTQADGTSAAYLIYTSGSTGRPKGVSVPQHAVVNFLRSMASEPGLRAGDRVLAVTTLGFDIAVLELLLPLSVGATIVLASDEEAVDGAALHRLIAQHAVTLLQATPSRWQLLLQAGWARTPGMRALVGGEPLPPVLVPALLERCDEVWNMYGPTETTVWSSCWRVQADAPVSLGKAIENTQLLVLDDHGALAPAAAWGEIWIGGIGVAEGYWKRPDITNERFRTPEHFGNVEGHRCYRTGDRGRWRHDGSLEHGGRLDDQVKLRGFRIELGEIEACLGSMPGIQRCVAMVREDVPGDQLLVAYVVTADPSLDLDSLKVRARTWLPDQMVPSLIVPLDTLPTLPNGKIDRRALPKPTSNAMRARVRKPPASEVEQRIAAIWSEILPHAEFGVDDNFFDLGGHSMLAVRMARRMEAEFKRPFQLNTLFEDPTIEGIARHLQDPGSIRDQRAALLRRGAEGKNLFMLAGAGMYQTLASQLSVDMSVYGLFSQTEIDLLELPVDRPLPDLSIEALADSYVKLIRGVQAHGPYFLGGYSIGGVLAYEVAQRLRVMDEKVGLIVMLDCALPGGGWKYMLAGLVRRFRMFRRDGLRHMIHLYRQMRMLKAAGAEPGGRRNLVYARAIQRYTASPSAIPVSFFQAAGDASSEPAYGWHALATHIAIERVPGRHADMLEMANAVELARRLSQHLAQRAMTGEPRLESAVSGSSEDSRISRGA
jgi:amino acid adenylation domain-containing protein